MLTPKFFAHKEVLLQNEVVQNGTKFQEVYLDENVILDSSIQHLVKKFEEMGTVRDLSGRSQRTKQTEEMMDAIKTRLEVTPTISSPWLTTQLPTSHTTTYRMMRQIVYPYKIQVVHELKHADPGKCIAFCKCCHACKEADGRGVRCQKIKLPRPIFFIFGRRRRFLPPQRHHLKVEFNIDHFVLGEHRERY